MNKNFEKFTPYTPRENFLVTLLQRIISEYKNLLERSRREKPFKIVEITHLSTVPGETEFAIQITNKNCVVHLTAAEIINNNYDLNDFNEFHASMIQQAAQGKLIEFLKLQNFQCEPSCRIISKKFSRELHQYIFTIEEDNGLRSVRTAEEIVNNKDLLKSLGIEDIYDLGYTRGGESITREKEALTLAKEQLLKSKNYFE